MSKSNIVVPEAKEALERFKMEAANEVGVQNHLKKSKTPILCGFREPQKTPQKAFKYIKQPKIHKNRCLLNFKNNKISTLKA